MSQACGKKILINLSNIHVGGALQVGIAFTLDMVNIYGKELERDEIDVFVSSSIKAQLGDTLLPKNFFIVDSRGLSLLYRSRRLGFNKYDVIFTLFGPLYCLCESYRITGFAQPWIIHESPICDIRGNSINKTKQRFKSIIQSLFFLLDDELIVEAEYIKKMLGEKLMYKNKIVSVASNSINPLLLGHDDKRHAMSKYRFLDDSLGLKFLYITRNYFHKDIATAVEIIDELNKTGIKSTLVITLSEYEYSKIPKSFNVINIGPVSASDVPCAYKSCDFAISTSRMECFSASGIEAFYFSTPFFCFDYIFNRDFCKDLANYIPVSNSKEASLFIKSIVNNQESMRIKATNAKKYVDDFTSENSSAVRSLIYLRKAIDSEKN